MTTTQTGQRVALYARVSGEEQKQGHNIDSQIAELKQFASQREWPIIEVYTDEAWSGAALARPALDRLRDDAGKKRFDVVLINDVDRLARDVTHLGVIKRDLERAGVQVIFRKIPSEASPTHNLLVNILGSFAEFERELILDRTRRGRRHKVETRQEFLGCIPPYGYRYTPGRKPDREGKLTVNPEEAANVRQMFNWDDAQEMSARDVVERLGCEGNRPRKGAASWGKSSVLRILRSSVYAGTWHYNKHQLSYPRYITPESESRAKKSSNRLRAKEDWIPVVLPDSLKIISPEQWQRAQEQLDRNRCFSPRNSHHEYLLSGLVRCGGCGASYVGNPSHGFFQYRCMKRCKRLPIITDWMLESSVWDALERALNEPAILAKAIGEMKQPVVSATNEGVQFDAALDSVAREEKRVVEAYRLSILTPDQLAHELELIAGRRKLLEKQKRDLAQYLQPALPVTASVDDYCRQIRDRLSNLTFETKRSIVRLLVRKIVFEGDQVRISGVIRLPDRNGNSAKLPIDDGSDDGGIENTEVHSRARNPANSSGIRNTEVDTPERNPAIHAEFTLVEPIVMRISERAKAARMTNLLKATAARCKLHHPTLGCPASQCLRHLDRASYEERRNSMGAVSHQEDDDRDREDGLASQQKDDDDSKEEEADTEETK